MTPLNSEEQYKDGPEFAQMMDNNDPLGHFRQHFYLKKDVNYMCGNSLGLACKDAEEEILNVLQHWKTQGVNIWHINKCKYLKYSANLAELMAPLVGADKNEIAIANSTTVNIHQVIATFYKPTKSKFKILVDDVNFPTDRYAVDGQVRLKGYDPKAAVKVVKAQGRFLKEDDIINAMSSDVALILLPTVVYRTSQVLDMKKVTSAAKSRGILIGWDLCHAVGALEIDLKSLDADFAVWCTYKYLNGGPGSPGAMYINKRHFSLMPGLPGWYGNKIETQFQLRQEFDHQEDANGLQIGTPTLLTMAGLEGSLKVFMKAGMEQIRKKSLHITGYMVFLVEKRLKEYDFAVGNPREDSQRGGHVCLEHPEGYRINLVLKKRGVVSDFREPNVIRLTPAALYTTYEQVYDLVEVLEDIMTTECYLDYSYKRSLVV